MEIIKSISETMICGGPVMVPIIIVSLIVWTLIIKKLWKLKTEDINPDMFTEKIIKFLSAGEIKEARNLCASTYGIVPKTIKAILCDRVKTKQSLLSSVHEVLASEYPKLEQYLSTIATLSSVAPLLGLLGTVTGMVSTFTSITLHGTGDPQSLAKGISEALITTQSGLIVAIPALFFHNHLLKKVDNIMNGLEKNVAKLINFFAQEVQDE